ncbi:Type I restriction-modification system, specificity subunit S [Streptococcus mitis]|uniref:Type I restriction-modification system, specificity subunit S n=3 Tax=Streptococcus TaxID=1301 RepID=A0A150NWJ5_STRMT|nr:Type I restriction-modification system, specificity subunit S [Streptococcus mitis]
MIGYIENFLKSIQFENSGSVQRQLTVPQIDKLYILVPKNEVLKKYHSMTINYYFEVENNEQQNQELIQLRDWLLPMLMNGQVKVE